MPNPQPRGRWSPDIVAAPRRWPVARRANARRDASPGLATPIIALSRGRITGTRPWRQPPSKAESSRALSISTDATISVNRSLLYSSDAQKKIN